MRISDWSSDVCSSDLILNLSPVGDVDAAGIDEAQIIGVDIAERSGDGQPVARRADVAAERPASFEFDALKARLDRKSVVSGKRVSVRVDLGGRRIHKTQTTHQSHTQPHINPTN